MPVKMLPGAIFPESTENKSMLIYEYQHYVYSGERQLDRPFHSKTRIPPRCAVRTVQRDRWTHDFGVFAWTRSAQKRPRTNVHSRRIVGE